MGFKNDLPKNNFISILQLAGFVIFLFFSISLSAQDKTGPKISTNDPMNIKPKGENPVWGKNIDPQMLAVIEQFQAFAGEPTDHEIIPFGKGICGQVAVSNQNFVVPDVKAQDNYIACSINVKAEIVIPLFVNGENVGQIDIDSHTANPFSKQDEDFLVWVNEQVASIL